MGELITAFGIKLATTAVMEATKYVWHIWVEREHVVYNGVWRISPADVKGEGGKVYDSSNNPIGEKGEGQLEVENNIINVTRTNTGGRFHIFLERVGRNRTKFFERRLDLDRRHLIFRFQAKTPTGTHVLRATAHEVDTETRKWTFLGEHKRTVDSREWRSYVMSFSFDATRFAYIRIDDQDVSIAPSSVQIRRLLVTALPR